MLKFPGPFRPQDHRRILAVFAHPDDETFLVGGTLAHYARQGVRVELLCLTRGEKGSPEKLGDSGERKLARLRQAELEKCCRVLGVRLLPGQTFPDGQLGETGLAQLTQPIEKALRERQPDLVLTFGADALTGHPDHLAIHHATTRAFHRAARPGSALFYASLAAHSVDQLSNKMEGDLDGLPLRLTGRRAEEAFAALDIRQTNHLKWQALACHRTQAASFGGLSQQDLHLLGQAEYFWLAAIAGKNLAATRFPFPVQPDLFEGLTHYKEAAFEKAS
jgi:LmbE family N-acetylglucosaminyl deacetylase